MAVKFGLVNVTQVAELKETVIVLRRQLGIDKDGKTFLVTFLTLGAYDPDKHEWEHDDERFILAWKYIDIYPLPEDIELTMNKCELK